MSHHVSEFQAAVQVLYGHRCIEQPGALLARLGKPGSRVMIVSDQGIADLPFFSNLTQELRDEGFQIATHTSLSGEPDANDVQSLRDLLHQESSDIVLGIGGGSALDLSKLGAALTESDRKVDDYALAMRALPQRTCKLVLIPTTAGTGSEATRVAIYANASGKKTWVYGNSLRADLTILDSALTRTLPTKIVAESGLDALIHAVEASCNVNAHAFTIGYTFQAIRLIKRSLPRWLEHPEDEKARMEMLIASCLAGMAIDQGGTAMGHAFGHALGSLAKVSHGRSVALGFIASLPWMLDQDAEAFLDPAEGFGIQQRGRTAAEVGQEFQSTFETFVRNTGVSLDLSDTGLTKADVDRLSREVMNEENQAMCRATRGEFTEEVARTISTRLFELE